MMTLGILLLVAGTAHADMPSGTAQKRNAPAPSKAASGFNTNIFEKSQYSMNFTDTVKLIRDGDNASEVMFMTKPGFFTAPSDETSMSKLVESQSSKTPVQVTVDEESRKIIRVHMTKKAEETGSGAGR